MEDERELSQQAKLLGYGKPNVIPYSLGSPNGAVLRSPFLPQAHEKVRGVK